MFIKNSNEINSTPMEFYSFWTAMLQNKYRESLYRGGEYNGAWIGAKRCPKRIRKGKREGQGAKLPLLRQTLRDIPGPMRVYRLGPLFSLFILLKADYLLQPLPGLHRRRLIWISQRCHGHSPDTFWNLQDSLNLTLVKGTNPTRP